MNARDPREALFKGNVADSDFSAADYAHFYRTEPQEVTDRGRYWYARGQNFAIVHVHAQAGETIRRPNQCDEYAVLLPEDGDARLQIDWNGAVPLEVPGGSLVFIPPGRSSITVLAGGTFCMLFSTRSQDICDKCVNALSYGRPHPNIPPLEAWPEPVGGWKVRRYSLDVPEQEGRFGRIWRCTTLMINVVPSAFWHRGPSKLSPHHHETFEQGSLALQGAYIHHLRWPWTANRLTWREDDHEYCASPSLAVIPPRVIHTSEGVGEDNHVMVDVFSPPRVDFSLKEGWVLNADEYPMPLSA